MKTFVEYINESYVNLFQNDIDKKEQYAQEVWTILQNSYKGIGGIHGSGFSSIEDMIQNIPLWKINRKNGKIVFVSMYKDKNGRKLVAVGTDGSTEGKEVFKNWLKEELKTLRSYGEISDAILHVAQKYFGEYLEKAKIDPKVVERILGKPVIQHQDYSYTRMIGGVPHKKLMYGVPGQNIKKI